MWQGHPLLQLLFPASHLLLGILSWSHSSQLLLLFQNEVLSARSGPEATTWISLRYGERQLEGSPPDPLGAKLMAW